MKRSAPLRRSPINRKPSKAKRARFADDRVDQERRVAFYRARDRCEMCGSGYSLEVHHRRMRSAGGLDHHTNYLVLCPTCHLDEVHGHPEWAYRHGLLLSRHTTNHPEPVLGCTRECAVDHLASCH